MFATCTTARSKPRITLSAKAPSVIGIVILRPASSSCMNEVTRILSKRSDISYLFSDGHRQVISVGTGDVSAEIFFGKLFECAVRAKLFDSFVYGFYKRFVVVALYDGDGDL